MPFDEKVKDMVKQMAAYRCCLCQKIGGIEVYPIIPKEYGGSDDMDNAAPLCLSCHGDFGDHPKKRKEIKKVRDWWYRMAAAKYPETVIDYATLNKMNSKLGAVQKGLSDLVELKRILRPLMNNILEKVTPTTASAVSSIIVDGVVSTIIGDIPFGTVRCKRCNAEVMAVNYCSYCGSRIWKSTA